MGCINQPHRKASVVNSSGKGVSDKVEANMQSSSKPNERKEMIEKKNEKTKSSKVDQAIPACDVMISYSHKDADTMSKVLDYLETNGHKVWTDRKLQSGQEFLTTIGEAILESKVFLPLLSNNYTLSHVCRDEQALAYLSGKPIFPLALKPRELLETNMDLGMRLQMARYKWHILSEDNFQSVMASFLAALRRSLQEVTQETGSDVTDDTQADRDFWQLHFEDASCVEWDMFWNIFLNDYDQRILTLYGQGMRTRLGEILVRELEVVTSDDKVLKCHFLQYCKMDEATVSLWTRLRNQLTDDLAGWEVLEMDSSVRVAYIEHLGKVKSERTVDILLDLLDSGDADMKATAALSLAKTGHNSTTVIKTLLKCLESDDRLVRESGCLALGQLRARGAVPKLIHLWRNDVIADVRKACEVSLRLVGGEEAEKAIYVTNMLSREIRDLTEKATSG